MFGILGKAAKAGLGIGKKLGAGGMKAGMKASKPISMAGPTMGTAFSLLGKKGKKKPGV
jgi:hypothetical protein